MDADLHSQWLYFSSLKTVKLWFCDGFYFFFFLWWGTTGLLNRQCRLSIANCSAWKLLSFKLKIHTHKRLHFEYLRPFFAWAYLYFHLSVHKSLAKTYKRYFVQWHQREKIFLENFMLLNLHRFTVLSSQINAKPQCKHLDFENFGGVSFPNSNYWFYIIFSQGSWSQPHMSLE